MRRKRRILLGTGICIALIVVLLLFNTPERRIARFAGRYGDMLQTRIEAGEGIPERIGIRAWNTWAGEHEMWEFLLNSHGSGYYGCYYSVDDVPLAFQNTEESLEQHEDGTWHWQGEGDNHGCTWRLQPYWYGFSAVL